MALTLRIGDEPGAVHLELRELKPRWRSLEGGDGKRVGERRTWSVTAVLSAESADDLKALRDSVLDALRADPLNLYLLDGTTVVDSFVAAQLDDGPRFEEAALGAARGDSLSRRAAVSFEVAASRYDASGAVVDASLTTEHVWDEQAFRKRTGGLVKVREGADPYAWALHYQPSLPPGCRWLSRKVTVLPDGRSAEFEFVYTTAPVRIPSGVRFARRVVSAEEKEGRRLVTYEAEFNGSGAAAAAEEFRPPGRLVSDLRRIEQDSDRMTVRYTVLESAAEAAPSLKKVSFTLRGGLPETRALVARDDRVVVFRREKRPVEILEEGEAITVDALPEEVRPLTLPDLVLSEREIGIEPEAYGCDGRPTAYRRRWRFRYVARKATLAQEILATLLSARLQ